MSEQHAAALDAFAEALQDLLEARALSIGVIDIAVELNDLHLDGEILFNDSPDMGFTLDAREGAVAYCELLPPDSERWLDERVEGLRVLDLPRGEAGSEQRAAAALALLQGLLDARRPLLKR